MGSFVVSRFQPHGRPTGPVFKAPRTVDWMVWLAAVCELTRDCPPPIGLYDGEPWVAWDEGDPLFHPLSIEVSVYGPQMNTEAR